MAEENGLSHLESAGAEDYCQSNTKSPEETRTVRKLDWNLMPLVMGLCEQYPSLESLRLSTRHTYLGLCLRIVSASQLTTNP